MSHAPALPPLPHDFYTQQQGQGHGGRRAEASKPPIPPLPPNFHPDQSLDLAAPMPERIMPSLPADMARTLDESVSYSSPASRNSSLHPSQYQPDPYRRMSPAPPTGYPGGFAPPRTGPSPAPYQGQGYAPAPGYTSPPPPNGARYSSPPAPHQQSLSGAMSGLSISHPPPRASSAQPQSQYHPQSPYPAQSPYQQQGQGYPQSPYQQHPQSYPQSPQQHAQSPYPPQHPPAPTRRPSSPGSLGGQGRAPDLTAPLPSLATLSSTRPSPSSPPTSSLPWVRDVLFLVERHVSQNTPSQGAANVALEPELDGLLGLAAQMLLGMQQSGAVPPEGSFLLGSLHSTGVCPLVAHSPRDAFRLFEAAARQGFTKAWFRLGRDYEGVGDNTRARDCFERGLKGEGEVGCFYRMGMAHLLGQLGLVANHREALGLLKNAAGLSGIETPQPAYVYGLLLLGEFTQVRIDPALWRDSGLVRDGSSPPVEARKYVERAAYLGFAPAQYKLGHAYEYAVPPFPFDPLLSVQYYSLASQQGEPEADMALSKWFLCGAEGAFEKDEALAWTFADKAARKGLASAEFAMGYYAEVGVGGRKDVEAARKWYAKAVEHGNADAPERLAALSQPTPQALSRTDHDAITDVKLVRKHTQARNSSHAAGRVGASGAAAAGGAVIGRIQAQHGAPQQQGPPPQQQPQHQAPPPQHQPNAPRYSLTDSGSIPAISSPPPSSGTPPGGRAAGRPPGRRPQTTSPGPAPYQAPAHSHPPPPQRQSSAHADNHNPALPPPAAAPVRPANTGGPATFAEMGFQTGKAEDKDCVIM